MHSTRLIVFPKKAKTVLTASPRHGWRNRLRIPPAMRYAPSAAPLGPPAVAGAAASAAAAAAQTTAIAATAAVAAATAAVAAALSAAAAEPPGRWTSWRVAENSYRR